MTRPLFWFCALAVLLIAALGAASARSAPKSVWQASNSPEVTLTIRDKYGALRTYVVVFTVVAPDGKPYAIRRAVEGDSGVSVRFPDDFPTYARPGRHTWRAEVGGRVIVSGRFDYAAVRTYSDRVTVYDPVFR